MLYIDMNFVLKLITFINGNKSLGIRRHKTLKPKSFEEARINPIILNK